MTVFSSKDEDVMPCAYPVRIGTDTFVRCKKCHNCIQYNRRSLALRMYLEMSLHESSMFITLTYRPEDYHLKTCRRDLDNYIQRLRNNFPGLIRYTCCGEFGERRGRFHWHLMVYGLGTGQHRSITENWSLGFSSASQASSLKSCLYVAKYMTKTSPSKTTSSRSLGITRLKEIAQHHASIQDWMPGQTYGMKFGKWFYPFDRYAREVYNEEYERYGGSIISDQVAQCVFMSKEFPPALFGMNSPWKHKYADKHLADRPSFIVQRLTEDNYGTAEIEKAVEAF